MMAEDRPSFIIKRQASMSHPNASDILSINPFRKAKKCVRYLTVREVLFLLHTLTQGLQMQEGMTK